MSGFRRAPLPSLLDLAWRTAFRVGFPLARIWWRLAHARRAQWANERLNTIATFYANLLKRGLYSEGIIPLSGRNIWPLPFAVSAYFEPVFNPDGSRIPPALGTGVGPFLTLNVVPQAEGSLAVLSYPLEFRETLKDLLDPFRSPIKELAFVERVWETALRYCENIILAPHYWDTLPDPVQTAILEFYNSDPHVWRATPGPAISLFDWNTRIPKNEARARFKMEPGPPE